MPGSEVPPEARGLAERLAAAGGDAVVAVILYGSRLTKAAPDRFSAYDFVVVVADYGRFYQALREAGEVHRPPAMFRSLSFVLPPTAIAFAPDEGREGLAKCLVVRADHFAEALSERPRDHFLLGRMVQRVALVWSRSEQDARRIEEILSGARRRVLDWMEPWLEGPFDAGVLGRRLLEVCYQGEIRPEAGDRATRIFDAQESHFEEALTPGLEEAEAAGRLVRRADAWELARPADPRTRRYWSRHFLRSKVRSTLRWVKHVMTFDRWLPYIARKVERRTGQPVELTRMERRLPLIFLWPRIIRVLRSRPASEERG